jgi:hypothetical protein
LTGDPRRSAEIRREISSPSFGFKRRKKGRGKRKSWAFYRRPSVDMGLGFLERGAMDGQDDVVLIQVSLPEEDED